MRLAVLSKKKLCVKPKFYIFFLGGGAILMMTTMFMFYVCLIFLNRILRRDLFTWVNRPLLVP